MMGRITDFHGGNTGSNPVGDANKIKDLDIIDCRPLEPPLLDLGFLCVLGVCLRVPSWLRCWFTKKAFAGYSRLHGNLSQHRAAWGIMKAENKSIRLSATDLSNHLACRHLTAIELAVAQGTKKAPLWKNPDAWVLQQRGLEHEQSYVEHLRAAGRSV